MALPKIPRVETMSVSESRRQYSEILNRVYRDNDRVVIEKNGIPVAAIVPIAVAEDADEKERRRAEFRASLDATRREFRNIPADEIEREIAKAIAEVEESRRKRGEESNSSRT